MDYSLLALIALIAVTIVLSTRHHRYSWSSPRHQYRRVFSIGAFGLWLTVAGAIGWDLKYVRGFFQGTKWVGTPIWWQLGLGVVLLAIAVWLARRIPAERKATRPRLS
jgi:hypothetical protein